MTGNGKESANMRACWIVLTACGISLAHCSPKNPSLQSPLPDRNTEDEREAEPGKSRQRGAVSGNDEDIRHGEPSNGEFGSVNEHSRTGEAIPLLADLPKGEAQRQKLCARGGRDKIREVFCGSSVPQINSLRDLQRAVGLDIDARGGGLFGGGGGTGFVFNAASSSLVARSTSSINPRLIMFSRGNTNSLVSLGFVRGEQFAEIAARDPESGVLRFFLVEFQQECNQRPGGCNNGDLLTPALEKNWRSYTIYEDADLENTIVDCLQCHQPEGTQGQRILRMQERVNPWLHFMRNSTAGGRQLLADFRAAQGDDEYAGIPAARFGESDPAQLQNFVESAGFRNQPNEFNSAAISGQGFFGGGRGGRESAEWNRIYEGFVQGRFIPPPYHQLRISSPEKLQSMTQHYQSYRRGEVRPEDLKDIRDVFDDAGLRDMGFMVKDGLSGQEIITQACSQCHHDRLNQNITRAKFKLDPNRMDCEERKVAIERLRLPAHDVKRMPPAKFRTLTDAEIAKVEAVLQCR